MRYLVGEAFGEDEKLVGSSEGQSEGGKGLSGRATERP